NLAAWSGAHTTAETNSHHTSSTNDRIGAALAEKWTTLPSGGTARVGGAALYKHCVYSVDGNLILHCYDSKPGQDLDGDGNPDDGFPDQILGLPYDEVWEVPLKQFAGGAANGASTPTVFEVYDPSQAGTTTSLPDPKGGTYPLQ